MRVARMGYTQRVTKRDKRGRITSSWVRVRIVVPDGLSPSLPPPYAGKKNLTKKTSDEREAAEWTGRFLAIIDQAAGRASAYSEVVGLDRLSDQDRLRQAPAVLAKFDKWLYELTVRPAWMAKTEPVIFEPMIERWAKYTNAPKKGRQDMETKCGRFAAYLGHDDMAKVTFENCRDYRDEMIEDGELSPGSISNHLKALKALFVYAFDNEPDRIPSNPMARVKFSPGKGEERDDFTGDERLTILRMARQAEPHIYWLNWLASFTGARLSELADAHTADIVCIDGIWALKIHCKHRSPDQRLKTIVSTRVVPLHSALLAEGFIEYVAIVGPGPLFPQLKLDGYGKRAGQASTDISDWLRNVVKITDDNKPFYSHRHTATSYLRNTLTPEGHPVVKEDVERYLTGHARNAAHAGYGKQWIDTLKAAVEVIPNPLQVPLRAIKGGASAGS
jgi:integrase